MDVSDSLKPIIIADSDDASRAALCKVFAGEYRVQEATGAAACADMLVYEQGTAAVLLSVAAPDDEGFAVLDAMDACGVLTSIPVIAVVPGGDEASQLKALDMGAVDVIPMPCLPRVMLNRVRGIIERKRTEKLAERSGLLERKLTQTETDEKCGIYNKRGFISHTAALLKANPDTRFALVRWDIDRFKVYNDIYGMAAGDKLLADIGEAYRNTRIPLMSYGHWESDHFVNCMPLERVNVNTLGSHISGIISRFHREFDFVIRMGIYVIDDPTIDIELMCDRALLALQSVKGSYSQRYAYYDESMREALIDEQTLTGEMETALNGGQFIVHLQPQYNYDNETLCGAEALVRWQHPRMGLIPPGRFIPLFERNGFISKLDEYVWRRTCRLVRGWLDKGLQVPPVSVNISRQDIYNPDLCDTLCALVREYGIGTSMLRLEITESAYVNNPDQLIRVVGRLRESGFYVEMDDFGSGYSSLNILKDVPVDMLKLDMRFLDPGDKSTERSGSILSAVVRMANMLGLDVIAEGVETRAQAEFLKSISCFLMQGYLFSKPIPPDEFEALLQAGKAASHIAYAGERDLTTVDFLNSASQEALIFNSFVSGAGILEYTGDSLAALRLNDRYFEVLGISRQDYLPYQYNLLERFDGAEREKVVALIDEALATGKEVMSERRAKPLRPDGDGMWLEIRVRRLARKGDSYLLYLSLDNITKRKLLEEHNVSLNQRLMALIDTVPGGIFTYTDDDNDDCFKFISDTLLELLGYSREEFISKFDNRFHNMVWREDRAAAIDKIMSDIARTGDFDTCEYRIETKNGELKWVFDAGRLVVDASGDRYFIVVVVDNDSKKALELRISQEKAEMQTLIDAIPGGVATYEVRDDGFRLIYASSGVGALTGRTNDEYADIVNTGGRLGIYSPDEPMAVREIRESVKNGKDVDITFRVPHKNGGLVWINLRGRRLGERDGYPVFHAVFHNQSITMELYRRIIDESNDALVVADRATREVLFANAAALKMYGVDEFSYYERKCHSLLLNEDEVCPGCPVDELGDEPSSLELNHDGRHYVSRVTRLIWNGRDAFISHLTDRTEEWKAQSRLQRVLTNIPGGLAEFRVDEDDITCVYVSDSAYAILGYKPACDSDMRVSKNLGIIHEDDREGLIAQAKQAIAARGALDADFRVLASAGTPKWVNLKANPVEMDDGTLHYFGVYSDVTARRQQEEALRIRGEEYRLCVVRSNMAIFRYNIRTGQADIGEEYARMLNVRPDDNDLPERILASGHVSSDSADAWRAFFAQLRRGEAEGRAEVGISLPDKPRRWMSLWFTSVKDKYGSPISAVISVEDVTEKREIDKNRAFERSSLFAALRMIYPLILTANLSRNSYYTLERRNFLSSRTTKRGVFDELVDLCVSQLPPDDGRRFREAFGREALIESFRAGNDVIRLEYLQYSDDGALHWMETTIIKVDNPYDDDLLELTLTRPIDDAKLNEQRLTRALESSEDILTRQRKFRDIVKRNTRTLIEVRYAGQNAPDYRLGNIAALYDYTEAELDALRQGGSSAREARRLADEAVERGDERYEVEYSIELKYGGQAWVMERGERFAGADGRRGYVITTIDNTSNRSLVERVRMNEEELRLAAARMGAYFVRFDIKRRALTLPSDYAKLWGIGETILGAPESISAMKYLFYDDEAANAFQRLYERMIEGEPSGEGEVHVMRPTTGEAWERAEFATIFDADGAPTHAIITVMDTTARHMQEAETAELRRNEQIMRVVAEHSGRVVYFYDPEQQRALALNGAQCRELGLPDSCEPESLMRECALTPESADALIELFRRIGLGEKRGDARLHLHDMRDKERWLELRFSGLTGEDGRASGAVLSFLDITSQHVRELAYARYLQTITENSAGQGMYFETDITADVVEKCGGKLLPENTVIVGNSYNEILSFLLDKYFAISERKRAYNDLRRERLMQLYAQGSHDIAGDWQINPARGARRWARVSMQLVIDPYTEHLRSLCIIRDITEDKERQLSVQRQAELDGLTGIYNRATAEKRIIDMLKAPSGRCALLILDLDNLKRINDTMGHGQGDTALRSVGEELNRRFRGTDVVGRLGGDEYIVFLPGIRSDSALTSLISTLLKRLSSIVIGNGHKIHCSIGCATGRHGEDSFEALYRRADLALYHVKRNGKNDYAFFTPEMEQKDYRHQSHGDSPSAL